MPFTNVEQNIDKENDQRSRKRRASEGSILKPKPVVAERNDDGNSHWKRLFMSLQQERVTVVERQLFSFMEESEKREDSLKNYICHLESDLVEARKSLLLSQGQATALVELQEKLDDTQMRMQTMRAEIMRLQDQLEAKDRANSHLKAQLTNLDDDVQMYKLLIQTEVTRGVEGSIECCVTNTIKEITTKFRLSNLEDDKMMMYEPLENPKPLPVFLQQAIEFERADCPALIQNILKGVFPEEE
jgi:chromosome segregation ATPase